MGTGSSISSIDHNIFQKPYEPLHTATPGHPGTQSRSYSYPPPSSASYGGYVPPPPLPQQNSTHGGMSYHVPPYPSSYNPYAEPKTGYPHAYTLQYNGYADPEHTTNIFYTPPPQYARSGNLPSAYVKQEPRLPPLGGWTEDLTRDIQSTSYDDYGRKRKVSPCEMGYPEKNTQAYPHNVSPPHYPYSTSTQTSPNSPPQPAYLKQEQLDVDLTTTVSTEGDGFRWRKYGRKSVKGSPYPRSYYKCTFGSCNVKKQVEMTLKEGKMVVKSCIYKGEHNHERPCITFAKATSQTAFKNAVIAGFIRHEKMLAGTGDVPRLSVEATKDVDFMDDGYRWRKYGQKYVKGSGYPRSYYKCTEKDCSVKKQVDQHGDRITNTYEGVHTHAPCVNNTRKRRRVETERQSVKEEVKDEIEEQPARCPTPPGGGSESPRWPQASNQGRQNIDLNEEDEEEEELESGESIRPTTKVFGGAIDDDEDDFEDVEPDEEEDFEYEHTTVTAAQHTQRGAYETQRL